MAELRELLAPPRRAHMVAESIVHPPDATAAARRPRVLVVDDDEAVRQEYAALLGAKGYEVHAAAGVYEGMRLAQRAVPDLIIADLVLPDGDGMAMMRALRAITSTMRVPVVAVTGSARSIALLDAATFGAECVLLKPVDPGELLGAVSRCLHAVDEGTALATSTASLSLVAPDGSRWSVHHIQGRGGAAEALIFVSKSGYHRVTEFPPDWRTLTPEALWALREPGP